MLSPATSTKASALSCIAIAPSSCATEPLTIGCITTQEFAKEARVCQQSVLNAAGKRIFVDVAFSSRGVNRDAGAAFELMQTYGQNQSK